ncbi:MAG: hypothetical protein HYZ45_05385 [Burkholderiales bacterium]|nr:hypothetical protein [Burkholderiales bacterium]
MKYKMICLLMACLSTAAHAADTAVVNGSVGNREKLEICQQKADQLKKQGLQVDALLKNNDGLYDSIRETVSELEDLKRVVAQGDILASNAANSKIAKHNRSILQYNEQALLVQKSSDAYNKTVEDYNKSCGGKVFDKEDRLLLHVQSTPTLNVAKPVQQGN